MQFSHLIEINDPRNPLIDPLTRAQLWRGLVLRAEAPKLFVPHLDHCEIVANIDATLSRVLRYGSVAICDRVIFTPQAVVLYEVPAQPEITASRLSMAIEEPQPQVLFVRFSYDDQTADAPGSEAAYYNQFRRAAYCEADIDTIRIIRELAGEGRFDLPPH